MNNDNLQATIMKIVNSIENEQTLYKILCFIQALLKSSK